MKIYKITEASAYLGISINSLKTLANNNKINSFKTDGEHRRFREDDLDTYMGVKKEKQERLTLKYLNKPIPKHSKDKRLNAHHIVAFSVDKSKIFDVNNGVSLCVDCHKNGQNGRRKGGV